MCFVFFIITTIWQASLVSQTVKNLPAMQQKKSPGEGNGNPLHYSCLKNPTDRGAWRVIVCGVAKCQARLNDPVTQPVSAAIWHRNGLFCRGGVWSSEKLNKLPIITQLRSGKAKIYRMWFVWMFQLIYWTEYIDRLCALSQLQLILSRIKILSDFPCRLL